MRTKVLYYPNEKRPDLEVEVTEDGTVISSNAFVPAFDVWIDAAELIKNRPQKLEQIREDAANLEWNDHGDYDYERFKDMVAEIVGLNRGESA